MNPYSRRQFLQQVSVGTSALAAMPALPLVAAPPVDRKLNIALCGLGRYAGYLAEGIAASTYCQLTGIVSGTPAKIEQWQKKYNLDPKNCYNYQNFDTIAGNKDIDVVYVVLPNGLHAEYTIRAAKAGKHVIVEKPMAISVAEGEAMIAACRAAGVQLAMGYRLHYEPYHQELMRLGQQKVFGQVRLVEVSLGYNLGAVDPADWHLKKALSGGGPLMNLGVYCVQSSRYVLGEEPVSVTAQAGPVQHKELYKEVEESITWQLTFPSGAIATSTSAYHFGVDRFYASADDGFFELSPAVSYGPFRGRTSKGELSFPDINQQAAQVDGIGQVLLAGKTLPDHIAGIEGLKDLRVLEAVYRAAETGRRVVV
jgi:predicted dehydrogenase